MFRKQADKSFRSGYLCSKSSDGEFGLLYNITMKQHSSPNSHLLRCQFEKDCNTILLSDLKKNLLRLNLNNLNYTPILAEKVSFFQFFSYDHDRIYVASSENQSKLYLVNTVNKKWQKFNLNINKIISFQINLIRNLILVADPVILNIIDERTKRDTLTYKPPKEQTILKSLFTANNRSVLVLTSDMNIKQLSLHDLSQQFSMFLPVAIPNPHLAISGNNKYLTINGSSHQLIVITKFAQNEPIVSILGFPFKIKSVKFDLQNNLVLLGRDQIIYYYIIQQNRLVRLYNHEKQHVIHSFDISLNNDYLCSISNFGTIFIYTLKQTLALWRQKKQLLQQKTVIQIQQFDTDEQKDYKDNYEQQDDNLEDLVKQIPAQSFYYPETQCQSYQQSGIDLKTKHSFQALKYKLKQDDFVEENEQQILQLVHVLSKTLNFQTNSLALFFIRWAIKVQKIIKSLSFLICPDIVAIIQKRFNLSFEDLTVKSICTIFLNYFNQNQWTQIMKFLIKNKQSPQVLVLLFFSLLRLRLPEITKCKSATQFQRVLKQGKQLPLQQLLQTTFKLSNTQKYKVLFNTLQDKPKESHYNTSRSSKDRIKQLLNKQQQIEQDIDSLNTRKDHLLENE